MTKYNVDYNLDNLRELAGQATEEEYNAGLSWYIEARRIGHGWGAEFGLRPDTVLGVISALSPRNEWSINIRNARAIIKAAQSGGFEKAWKVKVNTFNPNKRKAILIVLDDSPTPTLKGQKVLSFLHNQEHEDSECVTVDTHAFNAACGYMAIHTVMCDDGKRRMRGPSVTPKRYAEISELYHELAAEMGIRGYQAQAIVWVVWKRLHPKGK